MEVYKVYLFGKIFPVYVKCRDYLYDEGCLIFYNLNKYDVVASFNSHRVTGFKRIRWGSG